MMKFIVDAMLGKLSVWLRLTGYDTLYEPDVHDDELLVIAETESRTLLTSDNNLFERAKARGLESLLVRGSVDERIVFVFDKLNLTTEIDPSKARCSKCNGVLVEITKSEKEKIIDLVPVMTYSHYNLFWWCQRCNSVFFQGGYWSNILKYMKKIEQMVNRS